VIPRMAQLLAIPGPAGVPRALRRAATGLACAAVLASGAAGCKSIVPGTPAGVSVSPRPSASPAAQTSTKVSSDPACTQAQKAVSTFGPAAVRDAIEDKDSLDNAEIDLIVVVLNDAADSAGNSAVKQSIISLASDYLKLRNSLSRTIDSAIEKGIRAHTRNLKSQCRS
jgi:hypothetical protein